MTSRVLLVSDYHPPRLASTAPVHVEIELSVDEVDRSGKIPRWPYNVNVKIADGRESGRAGHLEAADEDQARLRAYGKAVDTLAEMLAHYVTITLR